MPRCGRASHAGNMTEYVLKKVADLAFTRIAQTLQKSNSELRTSTDQLEAALSHHLKDVKNWASEISFADFRGTKKTSDVFIPLDLFIQPRHLHIDRVEARLKVPLELILGDSSSPQNHLVILGQPGAGKTTLMKSLCHRLFTDPTFLEDDIDFPVLVRLRDLNQRSKAVDAETRMGDDDTLIRHIQHLLGIQIAFPAELMSDDHVKQRRTIRDRVVIDYLDGLKILLIFDGLDELSSKTRRNSIISEIRVLALQFEESRIILTSRTGEFNYHLDKMAHFEVSPLSDIQIETFACRWLGPSDGPQLIEQIHASPFVDTTIRPLTIAHLCAIYERVGRIPDKPKTVYRKIVNLLLAEWDEQRSVRRDSAYSSFDIDRKFEFLCNLAYVLTVTRRGSVFAREDLTNAYTRIYDNFGLPRGEASKVAGELETHTGLFLQAGYETYEFSHKSLQEYLTAEFIVRLPSIPDDPKVLLALPNELAIATAISSRPSEYFAQFVWERLPRMRKLFAFTRAFVNRLLLERPDFERTERVGCALLALYSEYMEAALNSGEQLPLFVIDNLSQEFGALGSLIKQRIRTDDLMEVFEVAARSEALDGPVYRLAKRPAKKSGGSALGAVLADKLPSDLWVRESLLEGIEGTLALEDAD